MDRCDAECKLIATIDDLAAPRPLRSGDESQDLAKTLSLHLQPFERALCSGANFQRLGLDWLLARPL